MDDIFAKSADSNTERGGHYFSCVQSANALKNRLYEYLFSYSVDKKKKYFTILFFLIFI